MVQVYYTCKQDWDGDNELKVSMSDDSYVALFYLWLLVDDLGTLERLPHVRNVQAIYVSRFLPSATLSLS